MNIEVIREIFETLAKSYLKISDADNARKESHKFVAGLRAKLEDEFKKANLD